MKKSFRPAPLKWTWKSMWQNSESFSTKLTTIAGGIERDHKVRPVYFKYVQIVQVFLGPALGIISYWAIPSWLWSHTLVYAHIYTYTCVSSWKICFNPMEDDHSKPLKNRKRGFTLGSLKATLQGCISHIPPLIGSSEHHHLKKVPKGKGICYFVPNKVALL